MSNTHILIPIKDIELYKELINKENLDDSSFDKSYKLGKLRAIQTLESIGKQISLDEKDIENKGDDFGFQYHGDYDNSCTEIRAAEGYKQALKDLL